MIGKYVLRALELARAACERRAAYQSCRRAEPIAERRAVCPNDRICESPRARVREGSFAPIDEAIDAIRRGEMVIVVDDEDRENEGDLTIAAEKVTPDAINFMATHGRGLICMPMTGRASTSSRSRCMVDKNTAPLHTAFTVSIEARKGVSSGISAADRAATVRAAINAATKPGDLARPGHMFPLRAREGGVLVRAGHTEAAVDLARIAGLYPAGVICEIMSKDGTMARVPELTRFAKKHKLLMITVADLIRHRMRTESMVQQGRGGESANRVRIVPDPLLREPDRQGNTRRAGLRRHRRRRRRAWCACTRSA